MLFRVSLIIFIQERDATHIVTDTLATTVDGIPMMFQTKAWAVPHLNMAIAVTGLANLGAAWYNTLRDRAVARDITDVAEFAPHYLRSHFAELEEEERGSVETARVTCTVYQFGFHRGTGRAVRYVYRSRDNFEPEYFDEPGFGVKPAPGADGETLDLPESPAQIVELAIRCRAEQDRRPLADRIFIGGELHMLTLADGFAQTRRLARFSDYDEHWAEMNRLLDQRPTA